MTAQDENLVVVFGSCLAFIYFSYLTALSIVLSNDSLPLMALCKAGYLASSVIAVNCLLCLGRSAQGNPIDFNKKADLRELTLLTMISFAIYALSESGLFLEGFARQLSRVDLL